MTPSALSPASMINTFEKVNGPHPGFRRNHAKGVCVSGYFESNGRGADLSRAVVFRSGRVPVVGRFALAGGQPFVADAPQIVRSMAILFELPNGEEWRTGMNNIPVFPVNTAEAFHDQLLAAALDPATGKPDPAKMKAFLAAHPESAKAIQLIGNRQISSGFANSTYNSLNAFRLINATGVSVPVRWSMVGSAVRTDQHDRSSKSREELSFRCLDCRHPQPATAMAPRYHRGPAERLDERRDDSVAARWAAGRGRNADNRSRRERGHQPGA